MGGNSFRPMASNCMLSQSIIIAGDTMHTLSRRLLPSLQTAFANASKNILTNIKRQGRRVSFAAGFGVALAASVALGTEYQSLHAEWVYTAPPPDHSGFSFFTRPSESESRVKLGSMLPTEYAYDFMAPVGERFYASVSADFSDGSNILSSEFPCLPLDGKILVTLPKTALTIPLPSGERMDVLFDTNDKRVNGLVTTVPPGWASFDNGTNRYYGNHFEQLFTTPTASQLRVYPIKDFTGTPVLDALGNVKYSTFYYGSGVYVRGYVRNVTATTATAPNINGERKSIYAVVMVEKPAQRDLCRLNYTASTPEAETLTRISTPATGSDVKKMDDTDLALTKHYVYLDANGALWYVSHDDRRLRMHKWGPNNEQLATVDIDFDNLVVGGRLLPSIPTTQKIFRYARQENGSHLLTAKVDGGAIVTYELDALGSLVLNTAGTDVKKVVQGPFSAGAVDLVDVRPGPGIDRFNFVWSYPTGASTVPAGTYSIWNADRYSKYSSYFRIYPEDYAASYLKSNAGMYAVRLRAWPHSGHVFYAWGHGPSQPPGGQNVAGSSFIQANNPSGTGASQQKIFAIMPGRPNPGKTGVAEASRQDL